MVTDQELARCVESVLHQAAAAAAAANPSGPVTIHPDAVVRHLEGRLGLDLSHKAGFVRNQVNFLLGGSPASAPAPPPPPAAQKDYFSQPHFANYHPQAQQFQPQRFPLPSQPPQHSSPSRLVPNMSPYASLPSHLDISFHRFQHDQPEQPAGRFHLQDYETQPPPPPRQQVAEPPVKETGKKGAGTHQKESTSTGVKRKGGPGGLNKVCGVSPLLQTIVGQPTMARTEIVRQLWAYIRKNNLQDPNNKRKIICNDELRLVFETDSTDMFKMNKLLAKHITPLGPAKEPGSDSKRPKPTAKELLSSVEVNADQLPALLSDALTDFFGTGEKEMLQSEASRRVWDHIKSNKLEDPSNPMIVLCDTKLNQLFGCESISALGVTEMLSRHLFRQS